MRAVILFAGTIVAAFAMPQDEGARFLQRLLRDIPEEDLSGASIAESQIVVQAIMEKRTALLADTGTTASQCRPVCLEMAGQLEALCELHVLHEAPMSRAVCYGRVDDDRDRCLAACDG